MTSDLQAQVAVVGAGPAGLTAALALSAVGAEVVVAAPPHAADHGVADQRTTALLLGSLEMLRNLGVWELCADQSTDLSGIRIVDDRGGIMRAPEILFCAAELGLANFGANIPNPPLVAALRAAASKSPRLRWVPTAAVTKAVPSPDSVRLELAEGGSLTAALAVAADGRNSVVRAGAGIAAHTWRYPQAAIATSFSHTRPHDAITTELHRRAGPLTVVPLPGNQSSLVWVEAPPEAARLAALDDAGFLGSLDRRLQGLLGALSKPGPRAIYPLGGSSAERMAHNRVALVGEAAHVMPPIGAQGLNLGLRDAAVLADCVADARSRGRDVGSDGTLRAYCTARAADVLTRSVSVDLLNRSLLTDFVPVQALRGLGLHVLANLAPLRRLAMRGGLAPAGALPRLMRPGALP